MSLVASFLLTHTLSPSEYGMGMLFVSLIAMVSAVGSVGMDRVFLRHFYDKNYQDNIPLLLYCCLFFVALGVLTVFLIGSFFTNYMSAFFHLRGWVVWCLITIGEIVFILQIFSSLLPRLCEKPLLYAIGQLFQKASFLIAIMVLLFFSKKNSTVIIYSQLFSLGVCSAALIFFYKNTWKFPIELFRQLQYHSIKKLFYYGAPFIFSGSLLWISFNVDKFLLLKFSTADALGIYSAAFVLSMPLETIRSIFIVAWMPRCHQLLEEMPLKGKKVFHNTFHQVLWSFTVIISLLLLLKPLLGLFLGDAFRAAENIFGWLLLSIYFYGLSDIVTVGILKSKKTYWNIPISILCLLTNMIACYFFIPFWGVQGAAIANAISFGVFFLTRFVIGFWYYSFKIYYAPLFLYVLYLCVEILLANQNNVDWQCTVAILFLFVSFYLERKWMMNYVLSGFRKVYV